MEKRNPVRTLPESLCYVCVDVETSGPNPADYSLLSIGACLVEDISTKFYIELRPVSSKYVAAALAVCHLSLDELSRTGVSPKQAMAQFEGWLGDVVPRNKRPVFVAFNAVFDWMFVNDYFFRYLGRNPFGHSALDMKSYFMGVAGVPWNKTSLQQVIERYHTEHILTHNALQDALDQAELFLRIVAEQNAHIA